MHVDDQLLDAIGVQLVPGPVRIPLYCQTKFVEVPDANLPGMELFEARDVDPEIQFCAGLILQVFDGTQFRWYGNKETKEKFS